MNSIHETITARSQPLERIPTELTANLSSLKGIRAVVFDIYGTLMISGSGDIGSADDDSHQMAFRDAFATVGIDVISDIAAVEQHYRSAIAESHAEAKASGVEFPEVEIRDIWRHTLDQLVDQAIIKPVAITDELLERLSIEYEVRANPTWPMPNCRETLKA